MDCEQLLCHIYAHTWVVTSTHETLVGFWGGEIFPHYCICTLKCSTYSASWVLAMTKIPKKTSHAVRFPTRLTLWYRYPLNRLALWMETRYLLQFLWTHVDGNRCVCGIGTHTFFDQLNGFSLWFFWSSTFIALYTKCPVSFNASWVASVLRPETSAW